MMTSLSVTFNSHKNDMVFVNICCLVPSYLPRIPEQFVQVGETGAFINWMNWAYLTDFKSKVTILSAFL